MEMGMEMEFVIPCLQAAAFDLISALESKTELMTVDDVASVFTISLSTVNRMIAKRTIPSFLVGGQRRFNPAQLVRWVINRTFAETVDLTGVSLIQIGNGLVAAVSEARLPIVRQFTWHAAWYPGARKYYVQSNERVNGKQITVRLQRLLLGLDKGSVERGDHINGDPLDNRDSNLRVATPTENSRNRGATRENKFGLKGVYKNKKKWGAQITINQQTTHLGTFSSPEEAHKAYCAKAAEVYGEFFNDGRAMRENRQ